MSVKADELIWTDPQSGLQWVRNAGIAEKSMKWDEARTWVHNLNYAGNSDWRLPSKDELSVMVKRGGEWLNANGLSNFQASWYWSGTEDDNDYAWVVYTNSGNVNFLHKIKYKSGVWPVRGKQGK
jgi:hypothetical protein